MIRTGAALGGADCAIDVDGASGWDRGGRDCSAANFAAAAFLQYHSAVNSYGSVTLVLQWD